MKDYNDNNLLLSNVRKNALKCCHIIFLQYHMYEHQRPGPE